MRETQGFERGAWLEESILSLRQCAPRGPYARPLACQVRESQRRGDPGAGVADEIRGLADGVPEPAQGVDAVLRRVASDDGGVQCTDRNAGNPCESDAGFRQAFVDAGLVGAQRPATLQDQGDFVVVAKILAARPPGIVLSSAMHIVLPDLIASTNRG
ncbi:hypothetical protein D3C72_1666520 [compost metagenome]